MTQLANRPRTQGQQTDLALVATLDMRGLTVHDVLLARRLNVGPLVRDPVCHGFSCGCACKDCTEREKKATQPVTLPAPQPWEAKHAA